MRNLAKAETLQKQAADEGPTTHVEQLDVNDGAWVDAAIGGVVESHGTGLEACTEFAQRGARR